MSKNIELDKFYTPKETAKQCIDLFFETFTDVTEIIEPSAGNGNFSLQIPNCIAYDLEPEHESITTQDFLKLESPYIKGRAFIGNPPFGDRNNLARSFYKHACKMGDYVGFILPISQMDNTDSLYYFDLVKSIDLGVLRYSGMKVHCCFNLYKRPKNGNLNERKNINPNLFILYGDDVYRGKRQKEYAELDYDFVIFRRGASAGKIKTENTNKQTYKIKVFEKENIEYVKNTILEFDWLNYKKHQSAPNITRNDIYRLFKSEEEKNKYGMSAQNFNRSTNVAMEHNSLIHAILLRNIFYN